MDAYELKRVKKLEAENTKLKRMYANLALKNGAVKELLDKSPRFDRSKEIGRTSNQKKDPAVSVF